MLIEDKKTGENYYIDNLKVAEICSVHIKTVQRWETGKQKPKQCCIDLLLRACGRLYDDNWKRWDIIDGELIAPNGHAYAPADIENIYYMKQLIRAYENELNKSQQTKKYYFSLLNRTNCVDINTRQRI